MLDSLGKGLTISAARTSNDWAGGSVDVSLDGTNFISSLKKVDIAIDVDLEDVGNMFMVFVSMRRSRVEDDVRLDLLNHMAAVIELSDVSDMISHTLKFVLERRAAHDRD